MRNVLGFADVLNMSTSLTFFDLLKLKCMGDSAHIKNGLFAPQKNDRTMTSFFFGGNSHVIILLDNTCKSSDRDPSHRCGRAITGHLLPVFGTFG